MSVHIRPVLSTFLASLLLASTLLPLATGPAYAAAPSAAGLEGDWLLPDKSLTRIYKCDTALCIKVLRTPPNAPEATDDANPDQALKKRSLCGLIVGKGFQPTGAGHAENGDLYDPKTGKTYHGSMVAVGDQLKLRGYLGVKLFGRTETWTRSQQPATQCTKPR